MMFQFFVRFYAFVFVSLSNALLGIPFLGRFIDLTLAFAASAVRFGAGNHVASNVNHCKRPKKMLQLYEYEGCPFCRRVREALTVLDLDAEIYPTPRETFKKYGYVDESRFRPAVLKLGGKLQFPFLVDPNNGVKMYESAKIVEYLWSEYGAEASPFVLDALASLPVLNLGVFLASGIRMLPQHGLLRTPSVNPEKKLVLYSMESSPYCRIVREALSTLELPYVLKNCAHGSLRNRLVFRKKYMSHLSSSRRMVGGLLKKNIVKLPFLVDENTGIEMSESAEIVQYLMKTYRKGDSVNESMFDYSTEGAADGHMKIM